MPTPKELSGQMFGELKGPMFLRTVDVVRNLIEARKTTFVPEGNQQLSLELGFGLGDKEAMSYTQALFVRGHALNQFIAFADEHDMIPTHWRKIHNDFLHTVFGIDVSFEREHQVLTVSRTENPEESIKFQHDGLLNNFAPSVRRAIAALAIVPEDAWHTIAKNGLVIGSAWGDYYDSPIHVEILSILLPDPDGILHYAKFPGLKSFSVGELIRINLPKKFEGKTTSQHEYLMSLKPMAVLSDLRTTTPA